MPPVPFSSLFAWRGYGTACSVAGALRRNASAGAVPRRAVVATSAEASQVRVVRRFVAAHMSRWGLTDEDRDSVVLIVGELAGNAARHGRAYMTVGVSLDDRDLCIEVIDGGPSQCDPLDPIEDEEEHGRGLEIVDHVACWTDITPVPHGWRSRAGLRVSLSADASPHVPAAAPSAHDPTADG